MERRIRRATAVRQRGPRRRFEMTDSIAASAAAPSWRARTLALIALLERFPLSLLQFLFRFTIAAIFWNSGLTKIASWQTTVVLFRDEYRVPPIPPELAAMLAATVELGCAVLLVLGLASRLATLPMLGMTFVIEAFVYPEDWIEHLTWASSLIFILTRGPGRVSLDHLIRRRLLG
jgi:putative oxidoreductase